MKKFNLADYQANEIPNEACAFVAWREARVPKVVIAIVDGVWVEVARYMNKRNASRYVKVNYPSGRGVCDCAIVRDIENFLENELSMRNKALA